MSPVLEVNHDCASPLLPTPSRHRINTKFAHGEQRVKLGKFKPIQLEELSSLNQIEKHFNPLQPSARLISNLNKPKKRKN